MKTLHKTVKIYKKDAEIIRTFTCNIGKDISLHDIYSIQAPKITITSVYSSSLRFNSKSYKNSLS
jgi:hypothetical protein